MKRLTNIAICGFILLFGSNIASAYIGMKLTCLDNPIARKDHLAVVCSIRDDAPQIATFEVIASNPELSIRGCTLDVILPYLYFTLVPNSVTGFGKSIGVMDKDGHCRMATAIGALDAPKKAQGVLLRFQIKLDIKNNVANPEFPIIPRVDLQRSGLVDTDGKFLNGSIIFISAGRFLIKQY